MADRHVMTIYPILFSGPMVRALLAGWKTQTRRLAVKDGKPTVWAKREAPYSLWVREGFRPHLNPSRRPLYIATSGSNPLGYGSVKPSIHMRRTDSRITLAVTAARPQRLHDITAADAIAEGMFQFAPGFWHVDGGLDGALCSDEPRKAFSWLWEDIHGSGAWGKNPEVVALTFAVEVAP